MELRKLYTRIPSIVGMAMKDARRVLGWGFQLGVASFDRNLSDYRGAVRAPQRLLKGAEELYTRVPSIVGMAKDSRRVIG